MLKNLYEELKLIQKKCSFVIKTCESHYLLKVLEIKERLSCTFKSTTKAWHIENIPIRILVHLDWYYLRWKVL